MSHRNLADRLREVERLLAEGASPADTAQEVATMFGVGLRQGQKYVAKVFDRWAEEEKEYRYLRKLKMRLSLGYLFREALKGKQYSAAISCLDRLCKLDGLFASKSFQVEHSGETATEIDQMTTPERRKHIDELLKVRTAMMAGKKSGGPDLN